MTGKKIVVYTFIIIAYTMIAWITALHQFQTSSIREKGLYERYYEAVACGIFWPVTGLFVWCDVYLWEGNQHIQSSEKGKISNDCD